MTITDDEAYMRGQMRARDGKPMGDLFRLQSIERASFKAGYRSVGQGAAHEPPDPIPPVCDHPKCDRSEGHAGDHSWWDDAANARVRTPAEGAP